MIHLAIGLGILGFLAMRHARRCAYAPHFDGGWHVPWGAYHDHDPLHRGPHDPWHRRGPRGRRRRWWLHRALARLDATPAQERAIVGALDTLRERVAGARDRVDGARGDLAAAVRGQAIDDAALGAVLGRVDAATAEARDAALEAVRSIHGVLDDAQRAHLADLLEGGRGGWWRGGPYR